MSMNYTPLPHEFLEEMDELTDEEYGRLVRWGQHYHITGEKLPLPGNERFAMKRMQMQIDRFTTAYNEKCDKAKASARMRWEANACERIPSDAKRCDTMRSDADNAKPKPKPNTKPISPNGDNNKRFTPPTIEEVAAYCRERKNSVDPHRFIAHYEAVGWKVGRNPMKDWKAAVRTWEQTEKPKMEIKGKTVYSGTQNPADVRSAYQRLLEEETA